MDTKKYEDQMPVDEGLQGNETIEEAILALQQEPTEEILAHTLTVIRRRARANGQFIVAVIPPVGAESSLQIQAIQTEDEHFSGCRVGCNRDIVHVTQAGNRMDVRFVLCVGHRITEKQHEVDLVVGDARVELLAPLRRVQVGADLQTGGLGDKPPGRKR